MSRFVPILTTALALLLAAAPEAPAQTTPPPAAYSGPRFPGGPDSLRALVCRSTRTATPAPAGRMLVEFELQANGKPHRFSMVRPPEPLNPALVNATASALNYLEARMPAWQLLPTADNAASGTDAKICLVLDFTTPQGAQPYYYADQQPVFSGLAKLVQARNKQFYDRLMADPAKQDWFNSSTKGLTTFTQLQVKYPIEALKKGLQGRVHAYFEVAENGTIEQLAILGTAGRALDTEVLNAVKTISAATSPAMLAGQPARMYYVLPVTFKIQ